MVALEDPSKLQVVIVGAGIAGLAVAIALRKHPGINVTLYDKATELREIGASIALGPNGLRTLQRLGLHHVISDDLCYRGPANTPMIYRHWKTNEVIGKDEHTENVTEHLHRTARYFRGHLHGALLENVPRNIIHLKKKLKTARADCQDGVILEFEDGTVVTADILLGADGLRSKVRTSFVPDFTLKWSGWTAFRSIFDASLAENIPDLPADSTHWWGPDTNFFCSRLGKNQFTIVGGVNVDPDDPNAPFKEAHWDQPADVELLRDIYKNWNPVVKSLTEITPDIRYYPNLSCGYALPTWIFGSRAALIGDAAHAHGGAHATGGSLAIDDAYCFYLSLTSVFPFDATRKPSAREIETALTLYESTRKPHAERLLKTVLAANKVKAEKQRRGVFETDVELRERASKGSGTTWLHEHNVVGAFQDTVRRMNQDVELSQGVFAKI